ncbi:MAG: hypothetical protein JOZ53_24565 [Planctomycetaceae bacterium]|jgi:hypothetical protein|nr:hypothetical protein [Planctomycetaceae bacterium]
MTPSMIEHRASSGPSPRPSVEDPGERRVEAPGAILVGPRQRTGWEDLLARALLLPGRCEELLEDSLFARAVADPAVRDRVAP